MNLFFSNFFRFGDFDLTEKTQNDGLLSKKFIILCYIYALTLTSFIWFLNAENSKGFAIISLAIGLFFLWGICSAFIMSKIKDPLKYFFQSRSYPIFIVVSLGGILLALVEEAFTTLMTNMAPLFGFSTSEVFITASSNYIEVVTKHSVIVFIPWFIAWGIILHKWSVHPNLVFILFGTTGLFAESLSFGLQNLLQFGFWIIIYGLMIYLPSFIVYDPKKLEPLKKKYFPLLIIVPFFALIIWAVLFSFIILIIT